MRPSYYNIQQFPALKELAENWTVIRDDFLKLNVPVMNIHRFGKTRDEVLKEVDDHMQEGKKFGWILGWGGNGVNRNWLTYPLIERDQKIPYIGMEMKNTIELLSKIKGVKVGAILKMNPHSFLPVHQHPEIFTEGLLQLHIPIETAKDANYAYLNVNGEFKQHVCGQPIVFDGSLDHFALNASNEARTILYMEFNKKALMS